MNLGLSIKIALAKSEMTYTELAEKVSIGQSQMSLISNNRRNTNTATLERIAGAFDMKVSELIELGEEKK